MQSRKAVILIGPPGSGKSSISRELSRKTKISSIETGTLLREEIENKTELGNKIEKTISSGEIVPSDIIEDLLSDKIQKTDGDMILLDGFPRIPEQIENFNSIADDLNLELDKVIILRMEDEIILRRISGRRICSKCGTIYNIYFNPPDDEDTCSKCGGKLEKRKDDSIEIIKERIKYYKSNTLKAAEYFKKEFPEKVIEIEADQELDLIVKDINKQIL